ncbi:MAG: carboxypeptidase-like regulatory domain-containing protein [Bacteroidales bacterium]|jgi:outer membrane cobalamin receptor
MNKYKLLLFLIFFLYGPVFVLSAQVLVSGKVYDARTNEPIIGANVIASELQKGTISDNEGNYRLDLPQGKHTIVFSFMGYETLNRSVNCNKDKIDLDAGLQESVTQIDEVEITAKSEARQLREQAMPIAVITLEELQGTVSDVSEVLSKTAGVKIRSSGGVGSSARISVRGLEGNRIGFYIDDTPLSDNTDFVDINDLPIDFIERVEVYKGIVPAKFGGASMGGAVNIVTKEYPPMYIDASYTIQSFNSHKITTVIKSNKNGIEFGGGGFYTYSDNSYKMELPNRAGTYVTRDHDKFKKLVGAVALTSKNWWFDEMEFEIPVVLTERQIQGIEDYDLKHAVSYANAVLFANSNNKSNFFIDGLDLVFDNAFGYTVYKYIDTASYLYGWDGERMDNFTDEGIGYGEIGRQPNDVYNQKYNFFQKTNLNYVINNTNSINLHSQYKFVRGIPQDTLRDYIVGQETNFNSTMNSWVTGLTYEFNSLNKKFSNALTAKHYYYSMITKLIDLYLLGTPEDIDMHKSDFGISDAFRYRFTPAFLVKTSLAYDVSLPTDEQLLGDGFLLAPAADLEPERNTSFNLGFMYDGAGMNHHRFQFEINGFYNYLENMIRFTGGPLQSKYENFGEMRTLGVETEIKWDATRWLYLWTNATYQDLRDTREYEPGTTVANPSKGHRIPNIPWLFVNAGFEMHKENLFGGTGQNTRLMGDCQFVEEYYYDFELSIDEPRRIPRAITFNVGLEHSLKDQSIYLSVKANNIFDATVISEFNRPLPGRNFGAKVRYVFK